MLNVMIVGSDNARSIELSGHGYRVTCVRSGAAAIVRRDDADVLLLTMDLPDLDGAEVCRRFRAASRSPIIGLFPRSDSLERVLALRAGLDVCLPSDCGTTEIAARIRVLTRRATTHRPVRRPLRHGALEIDPSAREVRLDGKRIRLTTKEFDLLHLLASQPGETFDRRRILTAVWDDDKAWMRRSRTIDTHVNSIRRKLGGSNVIHTTRGVGFRFCAS